MSSPLRSRMTLSGIPMVGYRNGGECRPRTSADFIRHSDGVVSEPRLMLAALLSRLYQAFRWWGIGTNADLGKHARGLYQAFRWWGIGTYFLGASRANILYQAFRWWGIGTNTPKRMSRRRTLSGIPMVGYRNVLGRSLSWWQDFIRHSDGGVSERGISAGRKARRLYQAFRWWGIGTDVRASAPQDMTLSGIPMVGYRNAQQ